MSPEWETWYQTHEPITGWYPNVAKLIAVWVTEAPMTLELGSGSGGNVEVILERGWRYTGIEGSETAVKTLKAKYPQATFIHGDFTELEPEPSKYDLVIDRASIPHNDLGGIEKALRFASASLKRGGILISSDWFSTNHSEHNRGTHWPGITRTFEDGQFAGVGKVHFSTENELTYLFKDWDRLYIEERITRRPESGGFVEEHPKRHNISDAFDEYQTAVWDLVVRKPR